MNDALRELREKKKLTQAQVAKKIGVTQQGYSLIETGNVQPSLETALRISALLKVPVNKIFSLEKQV